MKKLLTFYTQKANENGLKNKFITFVGYKIEINERIAHREQQRTTLQKIAYEAFKNGLSTQEQIQEKHHEDERNINVYILALPDSTIEALFTDQYGQPKPITVYK